MNALLDLYPALDNSWFITCQSKTLKKQPLRRVILGVPITLFRNGAGKAVALEDRCPHRNAPLSEGRVIKGQIQCPYHGWQFDGEGQCQKIPGLLGERPLMSYCVFSFPILEQAGFIWVYLSSSQQVPVNTPNDLPLFGDGRYVSFIWEVSIEASLLNATENLLDASHTHFVHAGLIRADQYRSPMTAIVQGTPGQVEVKYQDESQQRGLIASLFDRQRSHSYGRFLLPTVAQLEYRDTNSTRMLITAFFVPISEAKTHAYVVTTYPKLLLPSWLSHSIIKPLFWIALKQDLIMLKLQTKNIQSFGKEDFHSTELDLIRATIRQMLLAQTDITQQQSTVQINL